MKVTSRERTLIIVAAIAAVAVLAYYAATVLIPDSESLTQEVILKKKMLRSQRETLTQQEGYRLRLEQYKKQLAQDKTRFLPGDNVTLAGAELQKVIRNYADQIGLELNTSNIMQEEKIQDIATKVSVQINAPAQNATCTPDQLVALLASLENHEKLLIVDDMTVNARYPGGIRGLNTRKNEIQFSMTVSGFINPQQEQPKAKAANRSGTSDL